MADGAEDKGLTPEPVPVVDGQEAGGEGAEAQLSTPDGLPKYAKQLPKEFAESNKDLLAKYDSLPALIEGLMKPKTDDTVDDTDVEYDFTHQWDDEQTGTYVDAALKEAFKELGLEADKADRTHGAIVSALSESRKAMADKAGEDNERILRSVLGDKYDERMSDAKKLYSRFLPEGSDMEKVAKLTMLDRNPAFWSFLASLGEAYEPDTPPHGGRSTGPSEESGSWLV
jgi:hypothetical protein